VRSGYAERRRNYWFVRANRHRNSHCGPTGTGGSARWRRAMVAAVSFLRPALELVSTLVLSPAVTIAGTESSASSPLLRSPTRGVASARVR
jgi:hypothetical protein